VTARPDDGERAAEEHGVLGRGALGRGTPGRGTPEQSAARLLRWYPAGWRSRYGEEFTELLLADLADRPRNWRRTVDVIASGLLARLTNVGLTSHARDRSDQIRASLATLGCAVAAFLVLGLAMLAQLATGVRWIPSTTAATTSGIVVMSAATGAFVLLALLGAAPLAWSTVVGLVRRQSRNTARPAALAVAAAATLVTGAHHFQNAWPGTAAPFAHRTILPNGVAAFGWASTLSVSSYWAHPGELQRFPGLELAWMVVSPVALLCLIGGAAALLRRQRMSPRMLAYQGRLASIAALAMCGFFAGAACWVFGAGSGPPGMFHAGSVAVSGLAVMTVALVIAIRAAACCRRATLALSPRA
jgi:hypothetical protein